MADSTPRIGIVMGSRSDWPTMERAAHTLVELSIPHEVRVVSAHRTPQLLFDYADAAEAKGLSAIIAGAGGAAHLPGMLAARTWVPVFGVPVQSRALQGLDSLLSIVQMPAGVPVASVAIGSAGAKNAGFLAAQMLGVAVPGLHERLRSERAASAEGVAAKNDALQQKLEAG